MRGLSILLFFFPALLAEPALAQADGTADDEAIHGFVALGPGIVPDYDGADSYRIIPFAAATVRSGNLSLEIQGLRARADLIAAERFAAGPAINGRLSRNADEGPVDLLDDVDTAIEAGGFVGVRLGGDAHGQGRLSIDLTALADVSGTHDGFLASANIAYALIRNERFFFSLDGQTTYGSANYQRTYFGITPEESARSGLLAYRPGASLRDIGAGTSLGYQFDERWGLLGRLSYGYLVGDAADSPIVREEGSRHQGIAALALSYRF